MANLITLAAEGASHESGGVSPYAVGGGALLILLLLVLAVLSFGAGREHS